MPCLIAIVDLTHVQEIGGGGGGNKGGGEGKLAHTMLYCRLYPCRVSYTTWLCAECTMLCKRLQASIATIPVDMYSVQYQNLKKKFKCPP